MKWTERPVAEIWPSEIFQDGGGRHPGFLLTGNNAIRFAVPENPTLEPNMKWIGRSVAEIWPFEIFDMRDRSSVGRRYTQLLTFISYTPRARRKKMEGSVGGETDEFWHLVSSVKKLAKLSAREVGYVG